AAANGMYPMPAFSDRARHRREGHLLSEHQNQRLEQQGKAGELADPIGLDQRHLAVRQLDPACHLTSMRLPITAKSSLGSATEGFLWLPGPPGYGHDRIRGPYSTSSLWTRQDRCRWQMFWPRRRLRIAWFCWAIHSS